MLREGPQVRERDRVEVHVRHPGAGADRLCGLMRARFRWHAAAKVDELADPLPRRPGDRPGEELAVPRYDLTGLRVDRNELLPYLAVDGKMVLASEQEVVDRAMDGVWGSNPCTRIMVRNARAYG